MPRPRKLTLVEWLVIVAILGILAAILLPALHQAAGKHAQEPDAGGVVERPDDGAAPGTPGALKGFAAGVVVTLIATRLLRRGSRKRRRPDEGGKSD